MLGISEQMEKIFQWGKEILSFINPHRLLALPTHTIGCSSELESQD